MDSQADHPKLEIFFFPYILGGHLIPMIDLSRLFSSHGVKATIVTTPHNVLLFQNPILRDQQLGHAISFVTLSFPAEEFGLPNGCENELTTTNGDMFTKLFMAAMKLQDPLRKLLSETKPKPDCLVSDRLYPWTANVTDGLGIPRIVFDGSGCFSQCVEESLRVYAPHERVVSEMEAFVVPGLPNKIELKRSMLPDYVKSENVFTHFLNEALEGEINSDGVVVNSFYELEQAYADFFQKEMKRKTWHVGPVSLYNRSIIDKVERGIKTSIDEYSCLSWLDSREPNSVLYISFGSMPRITSAQLLEIAHGLEASDHHFIWVIGRILDYSSKEKQQVEMALLPVGFEERISKSQRGLIIRGWAPQLLILEHPAVGGYMNHCGWNSIIEGVTAGVPMITWPFSSEQFYNERFILNIIKVGISMGNEHWVPLKELPKVTIESDKVASVVYRPMGSEEAEVVQMRKTAAEFRDKAMQAFQEGGSSYNNVDAFIQELKSRRKVQNGHL
ncbi:hypothetical protein ACLB2K_020747 [Fragaria x ananassa]